MVATMQIPLPDKYELTGTPVELVGYNNEKYVFKKMQEIIFDDANGEMQVAYKCIECDYCSYNTTSVKVHSRSHKQNNRVSREKTEEIEKLKARIIDLTRYKTMFDALPQVIRARALEKFTEEQIQLQNKEDELAPIVHALEKYAEEQAVLTPVGATVKPYYSVEDLITLAFRTERADFKWTIQELIDNCRDQGWLSGESSATNAMRTRLSKMVSQGKAVRLAVGVYGPPNAPGPRAEISPLRTGSSPSIIEPFIIKSMANFPLKEVWEARDFVDLSKKDSSIPDLETGNLYSALTRLEKEGKLRRVDRGRYALNK